MKLPIGQRLPPMPTVEAWVRNEEQPIELNVDRLDGQWVVLFWYPRDFTFVCPTELQRFAELHDEFKALGATVLGASTDSFYAHNAWFQDDKRLIYVDYPVIADSTHELASRFGVLSEDGSAFRATFIIDPDGILRHMSVNDMDVGRNVDEVLRLLEALQTESLCPVNWTPGDETL